ncbi:hypothetical protein MRB53_032858 [Persea americana]|uniref:Uncharacterized protein n=1 Tax=Persea americana TaxID=3435 RepID=A0ACC2KTK9_PERAE|nr:hypothetical protein MRB53_032858 [Persea americana]
MDLGTSLRLSNNILSSILFSHSHQRSSLYISAANPLSNASFSIFATFSQRDFTCSRVSIEDFVTSMSEVNATVYNRIGTFSGSSQLIDDKRKSLAEGTMEIASNRPFSPLNRSTEVRFLSLPPILLFRMLLSRYSRPSLNETSHVAEYPSKIP